MPKNSSAKYYRKTNKGERYQDVSKMRKTESNNMVAKDIKISQEMKNESYLSIEKNKKYGKNKKCLTNKD